MDLEEYKPGWKRFVYLALNAEEGHKVFEFCKWDATLTRYNPYEFVIESDRIWIAVLPRAWGPEKSVCCIYWGPRSRKWYMAKPMANSPFHGKRIPDFFWGK